jgi:riboflavin biosynthesis pyrimidine reductase
VEGGTQTAELFHAAGLINEFWKIEKQVLLGEGKPAPQLAHVEFEKKFIVGQDNVWSKGSWPKIT